MTWGDHVDIQVGSTIELLGDNWRIVVIIVFYEYRFMSPRGIFTLVCVS